jgi:cytochrome c peroxidase
MATLEEVIDFYDAGGGANPYLDGEITPLHLQPYEKEALLAFLETLTGAGGCAH